MPMQDWNCPELRADTPKHPGFLDTARVLPPPCNSWILHTINMHIYIFVHCVICIAFDMTPNLDWYPTASTLHTGGDLLGDCD